MACTIVKISYPLIPWGLLDGIIKSACEDLLSIDSMGFVGWYYQVCLVYGPNHAGLAYLTVLEKPETSGHLYTLFMMEEQSYERSVEVVGPQDYFVSDDSSMDDAGDSSSIII